MVIKDMMVNALVLSHYIDTYLFNGSRYITELYKPGTDSTIMRCLRKVSLATGVGKSFFLEDWYESLNQYDCVILFDTGNADYLVKLIHKKAPATRLILWYWNPIEKTIPIERINREYCEVWSYHTDDCKNYDLKYNTQFFIPDDKNNVVGDADTEVINQDVYFVGADKDRSSILHKIEKALIKEDISYKFILTPVGNSKETCIPYSKPISAEESSDNVKHSKAIIDIVDEAQAAGLTLRPLEAAKQHKKLITNNKYITGVKFYSPKNIFIWGVDDIGSIKKFIDSPYDTGTDFQVEYYSYIKWINRFKI